MFLASCANTLGRGGLKKVCDISGFSKTTIIKGKKGLASGEYLTKEQIRKKGGGRKKLEETYPELPVWIEEIVSSETYGNPNNPLVWTTKSLRKIQEAVLSKHKSYNKVEGKYIYTDPLGNRITSRITCPGSSRSFWRSMASVR